MYSRLTTAIFLACAAVQINALPLNINLGAYSPALVVGDGAISFGGEEGREGGGAAEVAAALQAVAVPDAPVSSNSGGVTINPSQGTKARRDEQTAETARLAAEKRQVEDEEVEASLPKLVAEPAVLPELAAEEAGADDFTKNTDAETPVDVVVTKVRSRRQLQGFDRALTFAEVALTKGPKINLGTGAHGSGVGITVDPNPPAKGAGEAH